MNLAYWEREKLDLNPNLPGPKATFRFVSYGLRNMCLFIQPLGSLRTRGLGCLLDVE